MSDIYTTSPANSNSVAGLSGQAYLLRMLSTMIAQIGMMQRLAGDGSDGESTAQLPAFDRAALHDGLASLEQMAREMLYEVRAAGDDEHAETLPDLPLDEALSRLVDETAETLQLSSRVIFSGETRALSGEVERLLYRIAREVLAQVRRHSGAHRLRFTLSYGRTAVQMKIEDDGVTPEHSTLDFLGEGDASLPVPPFTSQAGESSDSLAQAALLLLRSRVEHLGGSLEIISSIEHGTQVHVSIPYLHQNHDAPLAAMSQTISTRPAPGRIRVLIVDNQAVIRAGLRRLIESYADLEVVGEAADGVQAVSETAELAPQVVILDAQLPQGQSLDALRQIKQLSPDTHVLLLSTLDREEYLYETLRAGADGYALKDIAPDELAQAVRMVARGEVLVQPQIAGRLISRFGRQGRAGGTLDVLTAREMEVLRLLARGLRNKEIAARLFVSERTVNFHLANIYQKLNVSGRTEALSKAHEQGLITA
jgi:DNA-binding NarL/FixJ family response regulator